MLRGRIHDVTLTSERFQITQVHDGSIKTKMIYE